MQQIYITNFKKARIFLFFVYFLFVFTQKETKNPRNADFSAIRLNVSDSTLV